jgi:O-acetylhomoserine (thiol)-lyase
MGGVIVDGGNFDWKQNDKFPGLTKPAPGYHGAIMADLAGPAAFAVKIRVTLMRDTGATISPFNSFLMLQGLETLSLRMERHTQNALKVVEYLSAHPQAESVNHPSIKSRHDHELYRRYYPNGAGSIFTFEVKGGVEEARRFCESLKLFSLVANVGDLKSIATHPASMTHSQLNEKELAEQEIKPNTVRLSIGTEHIDDIIWDLGQALA